MKFISEEPKKKEKAIRIILFSTRYDPWVKRLISWIEESNGKATAVLCRTYEDLREMSLLTPTGEGVLVLRIEDDELEDLKDMRRFLSRARVVIVYGGHHEMEPRNTHYFWPRFVGHEEQDLLPLYGILGQMMEKSDSPTDQDW